MRCSLFTTRKPSPTSFGWVARQNASARLAGVEPSADWAKAGERAWQKIDVLATEVCRENWPLDDASAWRALFHWFGSNEGDAPEVRHAHRGPQRMAA